VCAYVVRERDRERDREREREREYPVLPHGCQEVLEARCVANVLLMCC